MTKRTQRQGLRQRPKPSVARLTADAIGKLKGSDQRRSVRKPSMKSRSYAPSALNRYEAAIEARGVSAEEAVEHEDFFDVPVGTSRLGPSASLANLPRHTKPRFDARSSVPPITKKKNRISPQSQASTQASGYSISTRRRTTPPSQDSPDAGPARGNVRSWDKDGDNIPDALEKVFDNSDRHAVGIGLLEKMFGGSASSLGLKRNRRPFFTYWVTIIQLVIFIVVAATYGIAPVGLGVTKIQDEVLMTSLTVEFVSRDERDNMWIGPTQDALIHNGAKYSPCMRPDENLEKVLLLDRTIENDTACCVYNDGSGCVQALADQCSNSLATWLKWSSTNLGFQNRVSGSVCGQDPTYCARPQSSDVDVWPDDITEWPICESTYNITPVVTDYHMTCDVVGRPCCVGIQGECIVATREYCDFRKGYFHDDAALCSQVSCMGEVCGLLPFLTENEPDQFYRFFTSLFLHSGIVTMLITLFLQLILQRDLEKLIGWWRMAIVYLVGGICGGVGSGIFIPYFVETGPTGSQFAVIGALCVEIIRWNTDEREDEPGPAVGKVVGFVLFLFLVGAIFPEVDNWSHLFGFAIGVFLALALRPYKSNRGKPYSKGCKIGCILVSLLLAIGLLLLVILLFYFYPITNCEACMYFNCIPFTEEYCAGMGVSIGRNVSGVIVSGVQNV